MKSTSETKKDIKKDLIALSIISLICGMGLFAWSYKNVRGTFFIAPNSYKMTDGTITYSETDSSGGHGQPSSRFDINYTYTVAGTKFESNQVTFGSTGNTNFNIARSYVAKYPVGQHVQVFYLPNEPSFSVLEPNVTYQTETVALTLIVMIIVPVIVIPYCLYRMKRDRARLIDGINQ